MRSSLFLKAVAALIMSLMLLGVKVAAYEGETAEQMQNAANDFADNIEEYADEKTAEKAKNVMSSLSPEKIISSFSESFKEKISEFTKPLFRIISVILISAVFAVISSSFSGSAEIFDFAGMLFLILFTLSPISACIQYISESVSRLCSFMVSFIPSMTAIYIAGGNTSAAAGSSAVCSGAIAFLQLLSTRFIIPGAKVCASLAAVSALCRNVNLSGVISFIKTACMWGAGLIMTLFCGILSIQTHICCGADTLALKGVKFTAARLIPVAGGMISESLKTVLAGVSFIRGISGAAGIAFILYSVIPPIAAVLLLKLICIIGSMCAKIMGMSPQCSYLEALNGTLNLLFAVLMCCAASFIIMLAIFMKTAVSV